MIQTSGDDRAIENLYSGRAPASAAGKRLDAVLARCVAGLGVSRARVQEFVRQGLALVDGRVEDKPGRKLAGGEMLELSGRVRAPALQAGREGVRVLYRDEALAVVDKPAGLTTHPAPGIDEETLVHRLLRDFPEIAAQHEERPGIVHRLDKDTSGLILAALSDRARLKLSEAFAERATGKVYLALVYGVPAPAKGRIDAPVGRDPGSRTRMAVVAKGGRHALSDYAVAWTAPNGRFSLVAVRIHTGRTHQIRVHMAHIGHPLLGDAVYGPRQWAEMRREEPGLARLAARQMLHAFALAFPHPDDGRPMCFRSPPPADFRRLPLHLSRFVQRVAVVGLPGAGKSAFCRLLGQGGAAVFSADRAVALEYEPGADGWHLLRGRFGERFVPGADEPVDRRALFQAMRESPQVRREVEEIVHPLVRHRLHAFYAQHAGARLAVAEVPLFQEKGWREEADAVVCVRAASEVRLARVTARGLSPELAAWLDSWQWPDERKAAAADVVVVNDGSLADLSAEAARALCELRALRRARMRTLGERIAALWRGEGVPFLSDLAAEFACEYMTGPEDAGDPPDQGKGPGA
ncbi:Dephospho-CoA kinase [Desulfovibrio sp. X2]|uniref:dephospho-CoA kinase n=1 Tax=Desulfovibrio sp. X2 TaxID=941449 RepID=UPI0003589264|nr:dephospho-CoA kinase [Desulfovibrio sp. X2]EPR42821.1 Dephospho-CoA kinase [Desulfovibrio sp. X2]